MQLLTFVTQETEVSKLRLLVLAAISGIANSLLLVILNEAAAELENGEVEIQLLLQYLLTFILFIFTQRTAQREAVIAVEQAMQKVRIRLADKVRQSELRTIEQLGNISHYTPLTQSANTISQAAMYLLTGFESLLVLLFSSLYLLWLSPSSFAVAMVLITLTILLLVRHYRISFRELSEASRKEGQFFERFSTMLKGFKQIKASRRESDEIFRELTQLANETSELKSRSNARLLEDILLSNMAFYLLLLIVVFLLPNLIPVHEENLFQVIATILFMMEPVYTVSSAIPNISKTNVSISSLYKLEATLDKAHNDPTTDTTISPKLENFHTLGLQSASFTYTNTDGQPLFQAGPFQMQCQRGEMLFITGRNGSGKSTFLKLLTGLYHTDNADCVQVDGENLQAADYPAYRELFSIVFSDFHLFDRLYGLVDVSDDEINGWLSKLDLAHKTRFENGTFTQTDLSTGQRKRLAFIAAVVQHRPLLVLDEFAADQDPAFRQRFYEEILPELRAQGQTIIAVSHDDRYFHLADRVLHMETGQLQGYTP